MSWSTARSAGRPAGRIAWAALFCAALAQAHAEPAAPLYAFASVEEGRALLGARDDYVRASAPLERSARLRTAAAVDEAQWIARMQGTVLEWNDAERASLAPLIARLEGFLAQAKATRPAHILLVKADAELESGLPHTRANAIVLTREVMALPPRLFNFIFAHESFHILSRADPALREQLYAAIGFRRCAAMQIPDALSRLRITNPDAVENRHTIAVRYRGAAIEVMPYLKFSSAAVDPRRGFAASMRTAWLRVEREGEACRIEGEGEDLPLEELDGLYEQIGRNTRYLAHPEEILADNFGWLFVAAGGEQPAAVRSPEILERMRGILFGRQEAN